MVPRCSALLPLDTTSALENNLCCRLYVHTMRNPGLAEAYCDRMYNAMAKQQGRSMRPVLWGSYGEPSNYEMYLALIQVALSLVVLNAWTTLSDELPCCAAYISLPPLFCALSRMLCILGMPRAAGFKQPARRCT